MVHADKYCRSNDASCHSYLIMLAYLGEVAVVEAEDEDASLTEPPAQQGTPGWQRRKTGARLIRWMFPNTWGS